MDEREYRELKRAARQDHTSMGEWVRRVLRAAMAGRSPRSARDKLAALRRVMQNSGPTPEVEIDQMLREIEAGYLEETAPRS